MPDEVTLLKNMTSRVEVRKLLLWLQLLLGFRTFMLSAAESRYVSIFATKAEANRFLSADDLLSSRLESELCLLLEVLVCSASVTATGLGSAQRTNTRDVRTCMQRFTTCWSIVNTDLDRKNRNQAATSLIFFFFSIQVWMKTYKREQVMIKRLIRNNLDRYYAPIG